jgi:hypothetical protein
MTRARKIWLWVTAAVLIGIAIVILFPRKRFPIRRAEPITVLGVVLRQDSDPRKQLPIANATVTAASGASRVAGKSDETGSFKLTLRDGGEPGQTVALSFHEPNFQPLTLNDLPPDHLFVIHLTPLPHPAPARENKPEVAIKEVRLRYTVKQTTTMNVGSAAEPFEIENRANVPCANKPPCSPDGKWKAGIRPISLDSGEGNVFQNARVSCIAGPCPFSRVESNNLGRGERTISVSIRNWSDTVTYLVEAEVTRTMVSNIVRQAYPVRFGPAMNFTLPATAEGLSIEAELGGTDIVFPLGPELILSWANCGVEVAPDHTRLYQCELKPGYHFE